MKECCTSTSLFLIAGRRGRRLFDVFCTCSCVAHFSWSSSFISCLGEAYVEFETDKDRLAALDKSKQHIGSRYIEVYRATVGELERSAQSAPRSTHQSDSETAYSLPPAQLTNPKSFVLKMQGLPWDASDPDVRIFFAPIALGV